MLARLSLSTARFLDLRLDHSTESILEDEDNLVIDVEALRALVSPLPDIARRAAAICGRTITPVYKNLQYILHEDAECVAKLFSELDPFSDEDFFDEQELDRRVTLPCSTISRPDASPRERPPRKRRRSPSPLNHLLVIPSTHPSTPSIVVTPCPSVYQETSCHVPYQDDMFGNKLTVPLHPVYNKTFPPLMCAPSTPYNWDSWRTWEWKNGHWQAVLPSLDQQATRGLFSRAVVVKKRAPRSASSP